MEIALAAAEVALDIGEVPVGCAILFNNTVIFTYNLTNTIRDPLAHCELVALRILRDYYIKHDLIGEILKIDIFITLEPCVMCYRIIKDFIASLDKNIQCNIFFGAENEVFGVKSVLGIEFGVNMNNSECINVIKRFYEGNNPRISSSQL